MWPLPLSSVMPAGWEPGERWQVGLSQRECSMRPCRMTDVTDLHLNRCGGPPLTPKGVEASNHLQYERVRPRPSTTFQLPVSGILSQTGPTTRQLWGLAQIAV